MTEIASLFEDLARLDVRLAVEDGQLRIDASPGVMTHELQNRLRANKAEILVRLRSVRTPTQAPAPSPITSDPADDAKPFPLSDLQAGFFLADDPHMEYHVRPHMYSEFEYGELDLGRYTAAWNMVLHRHRRELCIVTPNVELQLLDQEPRVSCREYDWRAHSPAEAHAQMLRVREEMMRAELPFDAWPWFDLRVSRWIEEGRERARVHYNHNNFFIDGFGTAQLLAEVEDRYREPKQVPALALSYRDAVLGLQRLGDSPQGRQAKAYWDRRLAALPPPPDLPMNRKIDRRCRSRLDRREGALSADAWRSFKERANALGITPSNAIIAAYAYVLATWSNSDHFILSQMATRRFSDLHPDLGTMLGNFVSLYPLEVRLDPAASFVDNARAIQRQLFEDLDHLQIGGMQVLQTLNRRSNDFGAAPSPFVVGSGLFIRNYRKPSFCVLETSQTLLDHQFFELDDGSYFFVWDLLEEFFPAGLIDRMWSAFRGLLDRLAGEPGAWDLRHFELVGPADLAERNRVNETQVPLPSARLHDALEVRAGLAPDSIALISAEGSFSYAELAHWTQRAAAELAAEGVRRGDLVPLVLEKGADLAVAALAVLRLGAAYVPLDPALARDRLAYMLGEVGASVVVAREPVPASVRAHTGARVVFLPSRDKGASSVMVDCDSDSPRSNDHLAYVIYTSGSTGRPKGVMIDHRGAMNTVADLNRRFDVGASDRILGVSAFGFDLSVYDLFGSVAAGSTLVYPDPDLALDPSHWLDLMRDERITIWNSVPALMSLLVDAATRQGLQLPTLRLVMLSGDKIPLDLPDAIRRVAPNARIVSLGGATEASIWSICYPIEKISAEWDTVPYGYPLDNQTWQVLDRNGRPCATWVPGELCIGGTGLALGYWKDPAKTARSFPTDPHSGERLYRTGDRGRFLPGGCIEWMGRLDLQVKIHGHRIEIGEIEAALAEHPSVKDAAVVVVRSSGGSGPRLVAHVVASDDAMFDVSVLTAFLKDKLPTYMLPTGWHSRTHLPLTPNGKVDRKALAAEPDESLVRAPNVAECVAPANAVEAGLRRLWVATLKNGNIGVTDDFFDLGGQSFDAIRIFAVIRQTYGRAFSLGDLWRLRTIRALASALSHHAPRSKMDERVVRVNQVRTGRPLFLVHPAGGSVMAYAPLGRRLTRPLFGIQPATADTQIADIPTLARLYVGAIRRHQPQGPYSLGGWSSGAMIAMAMAAHLQACGEPVVRVFALDGPTPVAQSCREETLLRWFLQDVDPGLPLERLDETRMRGLMPRERLSVALACVGVKGRPELEMDELLGPFEAFRRIVLAGMRYQPTTIATDVTVVRVTDDIVEEFSSHPHRASSDWGWSAYTRGDVRTVRAPGTHYTFLDEPQVGEWWEALAES